MTDHITAGLLGLLALTLAVPLAGALPDQAAQQAHQNADFHAEGAPLGPHPGEAGEETDPENEGTESSEPPEERPPLQMGDEVPDFVTQIHESIGKFLAGQIDSSQLVEQIRSAVPEEGSAG